MPVRVVHHSNVVRAVHHHASVGWGRIKGVLRTTSTLRLPIPLLLPCEILLQLVDLLPPESAVCLVCACKYMRRLYCNDVSYPTDFLWEALLARTFPSRLTGAPGPNGPPRLKKSPRLVVCDFSKQWVAYCRMLRAVSSSRFDSTPSVCPRRALVCVLSASTFVCYIIHPQANPLIPLLNPLIPLPLTARAHVLRHTCAHTDASVHTQARACTCSRTPTAPTDACPSTHSGERIHPNRPASPLAS